MSGELPFAQRVARAMADRGLALRALCREVNVDPSFFSKVLAGKRSPPVEEDVLRRIAAVLKLDPAELVVSAGRIPSEWRRLWQDPALFRSMHALACGRAPSPTPSAPPVERPAPAVPRREPPARAHVPAPKGHFGDELL